MVIVEPFFLSPTRVESNNVHNIDEKFIIVINSLSQKCIKLCKWLIQEEKNLELRKEGRGVVLDSTLPHLIGIDDDILSTGIMLYHLKVNIKI